MNQKTVFSSEKSNIYQLLTALIALIVKTHIMTNKSCTPET